MIEHTFNLKLSQRIGYIVVGINLVALFFCTFSANFQSLFTDKLGIMDYAGFIMLLFLFLPMGIFLIASAFSKVIIRLDGIEYHTAILVLKAKWNQLENLGYHNQQYSGKSLVIAPTDGEVTLKSWSKPIKGILKHKVTDILISASWFKDSDGNSLDIDIVSYLPNKSLEVA